MNPFKVSIPRGYTKDTKIESMVDIYYEDEVDEKYVEVKVVDCITKIKPFKCRSLQVFMVDEAKQLKEAPQIEFIDRFVVKSIRHYEQLSFEMGVAKQKIIIWKNEISINELIESILYKNLDQFTVFDYMGNKENWEMLQGITIDTDSSTKASITSTLSSDENRYIKYLGELPLFQKDRTYEIELKADAIEGIECQLFCVLHTDDGAKHTYATEINQTLVINVAQEIKQCQVMLRLKGSGKVIIDDLRIRFSKTVLQTVSTGNDYLVLTNAYASNTHLYKNAFVHRRVINYKKYGVNCDVVVLGAQGGFRKYTFDGIEVWNTNKQQLIELLKQNKYKKILIHFVNEQMIEAVEASEISTQIILWIHGFGAERYQRRIYNYSEAYLKENKKMLEQRDEKQMKFMKKLYTSPNVTTVYVSEFIKRIAEEDAECKTFNSVIIPNIIDTHLFKPIKKNPNQRKHILFIRPFVAKNYACDLAIEAILELSKRSCFEDLVFNIYGTGPLFDEITEPIKKFKNVNLNKIFLKQDKIAQLHKKHGVMLIPTRHDTQGVTMGEAMSSGLVCVTNEVCAIPEFIDDSCGYVVPGEDYIGLADSIEQLYEDEEKWKTKSLNASNRVEEQCGIQGTIKRELEIITI